jgi:hypothetical protein
LLANAGKETSVTLGSSSSSALTSRSSSDTNVFDILYYNSPSPQEGARGLSV